MKLTKDILKELIEKEINECGMMPPPMPIVKGPHEDSPVTLVVPGVEGEAPDESPYPEDGMELITMIADMLDDFLDAAGHGGEEGHDCEVEHPDESHEHWRIKGMLGKEEEHEHHEGCGCG